MPVATPGGEAKVRVPGGLIKRAPAAAARRGHAEPPRHPRRPLREVVRIVVPKRLSRRERELFDELAARLHLRPEGGVDDPPALAAGVVIPSRTIGLDEFAGRAGLHPDMVAQRFVALGLLDATARRRRRAVVRAGPARASSPGSSGCERRCRSTTPHWVWSRPARPDPTSWSDAQQEGATPPWT